MMEFSVADLKWDHWHIEPSSKCALKCPRCPRQEVPETLLNQQLSLRFFQEQIGPDVIRNIKKITFCGNDGDPIYCSDFLEIVKYIKDVNPNIHLVTITNGSFKNTNWWASLGNLLNHNDEIHWSIDGFDHQSNIQYRVGSDWDSIIAGITAFSTVNHSSFKVWANIAFSFNEHHIEETKEIARELGFDLFQLTLSTKFGSKYPDQYGANDALAPTVNALQNVSDRFERQVFRLSAKNRPSDNLKEIFLLRAADLKKSPHSGICQIGNKGVFLNSRGEFYPCCWVANRYQHNQQWTHRGQEQFNLHSNTFAEVMRDPFWTSTFLEFSSQECQTKCTKDKLTNIEHIAEW